MSIPMSVSHVAPPRECDTRHIPSPDATTCATPDATTARKAAALRALARDRLVRHERDRGLENVATRLRQAINRCCDARGDDDANRQGLIEECSDLPPNGQADMLEHFHAEADRWECATGTQPRAAA